MDDILFPFLIPIFILALGALILPLLSALPRVRGLCVIAAGVAGLALIALWRLGTVLPVGGVASSWRPLGLFGAPLALKAAAGNWSLATVLVVTTLLSLVACCASADRPSSTNLALILAATGSGIAALFATSFVALVVAWAVTDLLMAAAMLRYGQEGTRRAGLALVSGILATSTLWAALLLAQTEGISSFLNLARFSGASAALLQVAVILRLGLVPFHLWRPIDLVTETAQLIPLVVVPSMLGFDLLTYLPALTAGLPSVVFALAAVTVLVGGFVAWSETEERSSLAGVMVAETGLAVLAVANAGQQAVATTVAAAVAWALSVTVFSLSPGWNRRYFWRAVPSLLALLSLLGFPPTLGFVVRFTAYSGLEASLPALIVSLLGETLVIAALVRLWYWAEPRPWPRQRLFQLVFLLVFGAAALSLLLIGWSPEIFAGRGQDTALLELEALIRQGGVAGWAGWALPLVAGITLFLLGEGQRQRLEGGWRGLGALLRLEWIYGLVFAALRWVGNLIRGISRVIEGEGALLWTAVILLIILLYVTGNRGGLGG
jgi:formate hydrogenlyase subunit 3/multisubunit Na+/H+ antiporter MnhD subunit